VKEIKQPRKPKIYLTLSVRTEEVSFKVISYLLTGKCTL